MTLPIVAYGAAVLRKVSEPINADYPNLTKLIEDMWETMYSSNGVGLAAPQINRDIRLFVVDSAQIFEHQEAEDKGKYPDEPGIKRVFINAHIKSLAGEGVLNSYHSSVQSNFFGKRSIPGKLLSCTLK